jgi:ketosteroid isomerase-like protein
VVKSALDLIRELDDRDIEASMSQDSAALLALWADDGVALPPDGDPVVGKEALRAWLCGSAETDYRITEYVHTFMERKILGEWAFE